MKFVIRDDDLSYYTDLQQIKRLYEPLFERGFKVSFATIPRERKVEHKEDRALYKQYDEYGWVGDNASLVNYIKGLVDKDFVEIMQHGFDHSYCIVDGKKFIGECIQKKQDILLKDFEEGKRHLEDIFGRRIVSFVPPSNQIDAKTVLVLKKIDIRFLSGLILPSFNRKLDYQNFSNWVISCAYRICRGHRFPYPMKNGSMKELTYYSLATLSDLKSQFDYCLCHNAPFVFAVHYWDILGNKSKMNIFMEFLSYVESKNVEKVLFREAFN
jgi:hypothetical protein